jgi:hypothetical protein
MCYNARVSIGTFLFVAVVAVYLWSRDKGIDKALALILVSIALMQLLEWGLWLNLSCNWLNRAITMIIPVYLALQPVVINWVVSDYAAGWATHYKEVATFVAATLVPFQAYRSYAAGPRCTSTDAAGHLVWNRGTLGPMSAAIYYPAMLYPLLTLKNTTFSALYVGFAALSHWRLKRGDKSGAWPSLWCHFINTLAAFAVVRGGV